MMESLRKGTRWKRRGLLLCGWLIFAVMFLWVGRTSGKLCYGELIRMAFSGPKSIWTKKDRDLEKALVYAGDNRSELEAVLFHYRDDERKKRAAEWLIRNMPGHYGYAPFEGLDSVKAVLRDLKAGEKVPIDRIRKWQTVNLESFKKVYDSKVISASYLISNIEQAFESLDSRPWNRYLSEEDFYELLLPYRVGNEPLGVDWRHLYAQRYGWVLDSLYAGSDVVKAVDTIHKQLEGDFFQYNTYFRLPSMGPDFLMETRIGVCKEICEFTLFLMRALGVPVAMDNNAMRSVHSWNVVLDTTGRYELFWMDQFKGTRISRGGDDGRKKGKVYRNTFAAPFQKDVSGSYFGSSSIRVPFSGKGPVWMGLFTEAKWHPVEPVRHIGPIAFFRDVEPGMVFTPMVDGCVAGYPVMLDDRSRRIQRLVPDHRRPVDVTVSRKTRLSGHVFSLMAGSEGVSFEVSDSPDFLDSRVVGICKRPRSNYNYVSVRDIGPFRYLRVAPPAGAPVQMAEVRLFGDTLLRDTVPVSLVRGEPDAALLVDDDELSYYLAGHKELSVVLDLGEKRRVSVIEWVPRNDDNFLRHGDEYELLYQDGRHGWKSLGSRIADDSVLVFKNAPSNALFRLHDITRGKEEEVFTESGDMQVFH